MAIPKDFDFISSDLSKVIDTTLGSYEIPPLPPNETEIAVKELVGIMQDMNEANKVESKKRGKADKRNLIIALCGVGLMLATLVVATISLIGQ